jgi:hypothetical protein
MYGGKKDFEEGKVAIRMSKRARMVRTLMVARLIYGSI